MNIRRRPGAKTGAAILTAALAVGAAVALPGTASAAPCNGLTTPGTSCTTSGSVTLTGNGLMLGGPPTLTWTGTLNGQAQTIYDTSGTDETVYAQDLRGLLSGVGSGWNVTATATTFTGTASSSNTLADITAGQVLGFGGGAAAAANNAPSTSCVFVTCVTPNNGVTTYPLFVPTGATATPVKVFSAESASGAGVIQLGGSSAAHPVVWSVAIPALQTADTYKSTITLSITSGP